MYNLIKMNDQLFEISTSAMQQIEEKFSKLQSDRKGSFQKLTWIESEVLEMKNNQDLDNTVRLRCYIF